MFPISNESGRVIAFTGRTLETGEKAGPKYFNSPETPLYSKSLVLFNLDKAKTAIRQAEFALLVEGQMDCISVFLRGIQNVIATSGTAFTEQQVGLLRRHTSQVLVNFDPDPAGNSAAAKTIALLTEEGFAIKIVTLDDGLDPDRYIRDRGVAVYTQALRGARSLDDFLIERARQMFPGARAEQKMKAMNFLLPHMGRLPQKQARIQFARDASVRLDIDSAVLRAELDQAARHGLDRMGARIAADVANLPKGFVAAPSVLREQIIEAAAMGKRGAVVRGSLLTGVERILLRALAITDPENEEARRRVMEAVSTQPAWFEPLGTFPALQALAGRQARDPMDVVEDPAQRALLAEVLLAETKPPEEGEALGAIQELQERAIMNRLRNLRALIAEAERRGDNTEVILLTQQKLQLDKALRQLHDYRPDGQS